MNLWCHWQATNQLVTSLEDLKWNSDVTGRLQISWWLHRKGLKWTSDVTGRLQISWWRHWKGLKWTSDVTGRLQIRWWHHLKGFKMNHWHYWKTANQLVTSFKDFLWAPHVREEFQVKASNKLMTPLEDFTWTSDVTGSLKWTTLNVIGFFKWVFYIIGLIWMNKWHYWKACDITERLLMTSDDIGRSYNL